MAAYRTRVRIVCDVLETAREDMQDGNGTSVTYMLRRANLSHPRMTGILGALVSQGLLEQATYRGSCRYRISQSGREFLQAYYSFTRFAESFGLSI